MNTARREKGTLTLMFALLLITLLGLMGFALDLAQAYNRRVELQVVADATALAAARALDGSVAGIANAASKAQQVLESNEYRGRSTSFTWSPDVLRFGDDPNAPETSWLDAGAINSNNVAQIRYARVDTSALADNPGNLGVTFSSLFKEGHVFSLRAIAVAGRDSIQVTPLGVCAMHQTRYTQRVHNAGVNNELVEHGFRRGVGYNLLNLNPEGPAPANFLLNPVDMPPRANNSAHLTSAFAAPYVCSGVLAGPANGNVYVSQPFPAGLVLAFNARFNQYGSGLCNASAAPPDHNIRVYDGNFFGWWMNAVPTTVSARSALDNNKLMTIADAAISSPLPNRADLGTLWSFAKPVAYDPSKPNYAGTPFVKSDWPFLYPSNPATASTYTNETVMPYLLGASPYLSVAPAPAARFRRILYVPLLACPVSGNEATVLAIGKFLMTAPATTSPLALHAEFGGLAREGELTNSVVLFK